MNLDIEDDLVIKRYLIGDLQQEEQLAIEERLFLDGQYFQTLQAIEDDLIDDYLYGELPPDERSKFEKHFLSTPERHEALKIAEALKHYLVTSTLAESNSSASALPSRPAPKATCLQSWRVYYSGWRLRFAAAAALFLVTTCALWMLFHALQTNNHPEQIQAGRSPVPQGQGEARSLAQNPQPEPNPQSDRASLPQQNQATQKREKPESVPQRELAKTVAGNNQAGKTAPSVKRPPSPHIYSFILVPGGANRGDGDINKVERHSDFVKLQLILLGGADFLAYHAKLFTDVNRPVRNWTGLKPTMGESGKSVSIKVLTKLLSEQSYQIKLSGDSASGDSRDIATYYFHVVK